MVFYFYFITLSSAAVIFYCSNNVSFLPSTLFRLHKIKMIIVVCRLSHYFYYDGLQYLLTAYIVSTLLSLVWY